jgi:hypothetical protein
MASFFTGIFTAKNQMKFSAGMKNYGQRFHREITAKISRNTRIDPAGLQIISIVYRQLLCLQSRRSIFVWLTPQSICSVVIVLP